VQERSAEQPTAAGSRRDERLCQLEAVLLVAREPLSTRKLSQYANLADATEARTLIRQLNEEYDHLGRAFRVEEVAGGFQLLTRPKFAAWLRRLETIPKETRLSAPALETMAVIAYRQPAGRAEIEAIRGVNCGEILRQLMDRDLVRITGRGNELGRPYLYATTKRFLQLFGLRSLDELPRAAQLRSGGPSPSSTKQPTSSANESPEEGSEEESQVTATIRFEMAPEELKRPLAGPVSAVAPRASDEEEFEEEEDELDDLDEDDDEDEDFDDEEFDDEDDDEDLEDEEDLEEEEWEEVDDDEDEWDEEEDDEDWDDDDEDDGEEEEEEEEESWE
jgi:segregation and condensation protein B